MRKLLVPLAALAAIAALPAPAQVRTTTIPLGATSGTLGNRDLTVGAQVPSAANSGTGSSSSSTTNTTTSNAGTSTTTTSTNSNSGTGGTSTTTTSGNGTGTVGTGTGTGTVGTGTATGNETTATGTGTDTGTGTPATNTAVNPIPSGSVGYFAGGIAAPAVALPDYGTAASGNGGAVIVNNNSVATQRTPTPTLDRAVDDYSRQRRSSREQSMWSTSPRTNNDRTWQMPDDYTPLMPGSR